MVWLRVLLCPLIVLGGRRHWSGRWLGFIVFIALIDDIYDGVLARHLGCDTPLLRRSDPAADTIFYLGVAATLWQTQPHIIRDNGLLLFVLAMLEVTRHVFDRIKSAGQQAITPTLQRCGGWSWLSR